MRSSTTRHFGDAQVEGAEQAAAVVALVVVVVVEEEEEESKEKLLRQNGASPKRRVRTASPTTRSDAHANSTCTGRSRWWYEYECESVGSWSELRTCRRNPKTAAWAAA